MIRRNYYFWKRTFDILVTLVVLTISAPLIFPVILINLVVYSGKPFFIQKRIGRREKPFNLVKLKTMADPYNLAPAISSERQRITSWGYFLRQTHLDEWPQLFQVISGKMSLVGPRPLLEEYLSFYTFVERERHQVLPGIMGLAQLKGGNALNWDHRLRYDVWYAKRTSFLFDLSLIFKNIFALFIARRHPTISERLDQYRLAKR